MIEKNKKRIILCDTGNNMKFNLFISWNATTPIYELSIVM